MKRFSQWFSVTILVATTGAVPLRADQVIFNGGFEDGTYTASVTDNTQTPPTVTSSVVPIGWTPNYAFAANPSANTVESTTVHSGSSALAIGNPDGALTAGLSQSFTDVAGENYIGTVWALDGGASDPSSYLSMTINGSVLIALNQFDSTWTEYTFLFTGTGSDYLDIQAQTSSSEWFVDDLSASEITPEPSSLLLLGSGLAALAVLIRRARRKTRIARV
jgi:hypothetical protein